MKQIVITALITFFATTFLMAVLVDGTYGSNSKKQDVIEFARQKPELVRGLKSKYEEQMKQVEINLVKNEKSAQDKLIEEVVNQLDPKK